MMKVSSRFLHLSLLMGATALQAADSGFPFQNTDLGLQGIRDKRSYQDNKNAHGQVEDFVRKIQQGQNQIDQLENENKQLEQRISSNNARKTDTEQAVSEAMKSFVGFLIKRENLGQADTLLELIPEQNRDEFNNKIKQMMPLIENYDKALDEFEKQNRGLIAIQEEFAKMGQANEIGRLHLQKDKLIAEYKRLNEQNAQMEAQKQERVGKMQSASERLEALRLKESQLDRDIKDLEIKIDGNNLTLKTDDVNRKQSKIMGETVKLLSPNERNDLINKNREAKKSIQEKKQELEQTKQTLNDLEEQLKQSGEGKVVFVHDQLSQKLDQINDVQTQINKLKAKMSNLDENQKKLRNELDGKEDKLEAMKEELTDGFKEIVDMIKGLPVSKSDDLARAKQIIESSEEKYPSSGMKTENDNREENPGDILGMPSEQPSGSFDEGSAGNVSNDSLDNRSIETPTSFKKPTVNIREFIAEMQHIQKIRGNVAPSPQEAAGRCEKAVEVASNLDAQGKNLLGKFMSQNKQFMGVSYRAATTGELKKILEANPENVASISNGICH